MKKNEIPKITIYILSALIFLLLVFFFIIRPSISLISSPSSSQNDTSSLGNSVYPEDFPTELKFPGNFSLSSSTSGNAMLGDKKGWSAESIFFGKPVDAEEIIVEHFLSLGWKIFERGQLDSGQVVLLFVQDQSDASIVIDIDHNDDSQSIIMSTLFK